jgi:hypothetical protein
MCKQISQAAAYSGGDADEWPGQLRELASVGKAATSDLGYSGLESECLLHHGGFRMQNLRQQACAPTVSMAGRPPPILLGSLRASFDPS